MTPELNNGACIAPKFVLTDPQLLTRRHRRGGDIVIIEGYPSPELRGLREQFRAGAAIAMPGDIGGEVHFVEIACHADRTHIDRSDFPRCLTDRLRQRTSRRAPEPTARSEEHTSELQSLMRISYAV